MLSSLLSSLSGKVMMILLLLVAMMTKFIATFP